MKLSRRIIWTISVALLLLFALWALVFYQTSQRRIYSRIDKLLTKQSDKIISRFMESDSIPRSLSGTSGTMEFFIEKVSPEYAQSHQALVFQTDEEYIDDLLDEETVREMRRLFNKEGIDYELTLTTQVFAWNDTLDFAIVSILTLALVLLIAIISIVSAIIISNMKPLYRLTGWLRTRKVNEDIPQPDSRIKVQEFKEIEAAVLEASEKSKKIYEEQKRFIGNASHEIQTPIAVCRNRLELLAENTQLDENQLSEIEKTLSTLSYISRLNKSLLMLSKIENHQFKEDTQIDINQVVHQSLETISEIYGHLHIDVKITENEPIQTIMDPTLASSLVNNLLKNAFVHNKAGGNINIEMKADTLTISNSGSEEALDGDAIFETFYKKGENTNSTGLGLAIAKAICNEYNFKINYQFAENQHFFIVSFK